MYADISPSVIPVSSLVPSRSTVATDCVRRCDFSFGGVGYGSGLNGLCETDKFDDCDVRGKSCSPLAFSNSERLVISGDESNDETSGDKAVDSGE